MSAVPIDVADVEQEPIKTITRINAYAREPLRTEASEHREIVSVADCLSGEATAELALVTSDAHATAAARRGFHPAWRLNH